MSKILACLPTSTDNQDLNIQQVESLEYARRNGLHIDDFVANSISSRRECHARRIDELLQKRADGDTLIVNELSRLGRSTGEVIDMVGELVRGGERVIVIKQNLILDKDRERITELLQLGVSSRLISTKRLGYGMPSSLNHHVRTRNLRSLAEAART